MIRRPWTRRLLGPQATPSGQAEFTLAEQSWGKSRGASLRWGAVGAVLGLLLALLVFAPAAWLASRVTAATDQRVILADARGTVWSGSAVAVLTGGPDSRDAASLPGRIEWTLGLHGVGLELRLRHACCVNGILALQVNPGLGRLGITLVPTSGWIAQWPSAFLGGLGTPWNTLQLGGVVRLVSPGLKLESAQGRWRVEGQAAIELIDASSRLTTLDTLGSYRFSLTGDPANPGISQLNLSTQEGALQLSGTGTWGSGGVRFRGEASAGPANEPALSNLLNIIGRRNGARSVISIG